MFNSFRQVGDNNNLFENDLGYTVEYNSPGDLETFLEQVNWLDPDKSLEFFWWKNNIISTSMIDHYTVAIWYPKGKRPPFSHKRND